MEETINTLVSKSKSYLPTTECKCKFEDALKHTLISNTATDLFKGLTLERKLRNFENAVHQTVQYCYDKEHDHPPLTSLIFPLLMKAMRHALSSTDSQKTQGSSAATKKALSKTSPTTTSKPSQQSARVSERKTFAQLTEDERTKVYTKLQKIGPCKTKANKHIKCSIPQCKFCQALYHHVNLTCCDAIHPASKKCISEGWYPHVGVGLWKVLEHHHSSGIYKPKPRPLRETEGPSIYDYLSKISDVSTVTEQTATLSLQQDDGLSDISDVTGIECSMTLTEPVPNASNESWNDLMREEQSISARRPHLSAQQRKRHKKSDAKTSSVKSLRLN